MKNIDQIVGQLSENFNFETVHAVMELLNMKWIMTRGKSPEIPTLQEIKAHAKFLVEKVLSNIEDGYVVSSGGMSAEIISVQDMPIVKLSFTPIEGFADIIEIGETVYEIEETTNGINIEYIMQKYGLSYDKAEEAFNGFIEYTKKYAP